MYLEGRTKGPATQRGDKRMMTAPIKPLAKVITCTETTETERQLASLKINDIIIMPAFAGSPISVKMQVGNVYLQDDVPVVWCDGGITILFDRPRRKFCYYYNIVGGEVVEHTVDSFFVQAR
ncbi:MAG: hypothetical protein EBZ75_13685 [Oxalobacteraceae bacterium]|nr:hypothetical protein [Oxalobacteraceae bacterium]